MFQSRASALARLFVGRSLVTKPFTGSVQGSALFWASLGTDTSGSTFEDCAYLARALLPVLLLPTFSPTSALFEIIWLRGQYLLQSTHGRSLRAAF